MKNLVRETAPNNRSRVINRRVALRGLGAGAAGVALAGAAKSVAAQEPASLAGHPLVGSWIVTGPSGSPDAVNSYSSDGIAQTSGRSGFGEEAAGFQTSAAVGLGVWEATSETGAALTWIVPTRDDQNNALNIVFRGIIEVAADGMTFESQVVLDVQSPQGMSFIMFPNAVSGRRIVVEPMPEVTMPPASPVAG
jgi:hypothetical protein